MGIAAAHPAPAADLRQEDLGELLSAFNEATSRLHGAHEALRAEVGRLQAELRDANEQLARSRRLAALGEMAAGIAHEVRNPLGSIRLYARMLEQDLIDRPDERRVAEKIGGAVRGLDAVVGDVLNFAKEMRVRPTVTAARSLLEGATDEVLAEDQFSRAAQSTASTIEVRFDAADDVSTSLECDEQLLHRALVNIIRNAVQAMRSIENAGEPRRHDLVLAAAISQDNPGSMVLTVRDSGPGIPPEAIDRIFNPFFTTRATGTGLGLAIVHRIIDAHGGTIHVRNVAAGGGAEVELVLPRSQRGVRGGTESGKQVVGLGGACESQDADRPRVYVCVGAESEKRGRVTEDAA